jgi:hypothetical protein
MTNFAKLPTWADKQRVYVVVETPRGSTSAPSTLREMAPSANRRDNRFEGAVTQGISIEIVEHPVLQAIRARAADEWPPSMNCRIEKISERRSYGEIGKDARITDATG